MLGDLLEIAGDSHIKFGGLLIATVWSLLSRSLAGYLLAATVGGGGVVALQYVFFSSLTLHTASHSQRAWGSTLAFLAGCLLVMACFSVIRFGFRDRMTWLVFGCIPPLAVSALLWWVPDVPAIAKALLLVILIGSLIWSSMRRALLALALLVVLQSALWFSAIGIALKPLSTIWKHAPADAIAVKLFVPPAFALSYGVLVILTCVLYTKVRRWICA